MNNKQLKGVLEASLLGAIIIGGVKYLALYVDPVFAPVLAGAPTGLIATYFLVSRNIVKEYVDNYLGVTTILLTSVIVFFIILKYTKIHMRIATTISLATWIILNLLKIGYNKKYIKI